MTILIIIVIVIFLIIMNLARLEYNKNVATFSAHVFPDVH